MKLSGRGHRFARRLAQPGGGRVRLAERAAALQLMRGRWADYHESQPMIDSMPTPRRSRGTVAWGAAVRGVSFDHCHGSRNWCIGILAAFLALAGSSETAVAQSEPKPSVVGTAKPIEASLRAIFEQSGVRAAAYCVVRDGHVISQNGFGFADAAKARPVDAESTVFRAASNGKVFVALSALLVEAAGRLDLRADVNSILKHARLPENLDAPVTLDHLLTHTGGFEDRFLGGLAASPEAVVPLSQYLATRMPQRVFPPGRWISYSNHGMALAGLVVADAAGKRFDDLVEALIFQPLGMAHSSFKQPPPATLLRSLVWDPRGQGPWLNPYPAGSLVTTAADMGRFMLALLGEAGADGTPFISESVRERLLSRHFTAHPAMPGVAYGFFEGMANGHRTLHHTGDGGSHSLIWLMPDMNAGLFVVYTAPIAADPAEPRERAAAAVADWLVPAHPFTLPAPPPDFAARAGRFVGIYRPTQLAATTLEKLAALPAQISVTDRDDGTLRLTLGLGAEPEVLVEAEPLLFRSASGVYVAFAEGLDGRIIGLTGTAGTVDDPLSAVRVRWLDDSRLHVGLIAAAIVVVALRLLVMLGELGLRAMRVVGRRRAATTPVLVPDGWAWSVSGVFALLCIAAPLVSAVSIIAAGGPMFQLPRGVYVGLSLLALASLAGVILVPLTARAWVRREGSGWHRVLLTAVAVAGAGAAPFLYYWNLLGFNT